ncbi:MAG: rhomboid family intramembrane serine protease [Candidatus Bathyarchaeota archaeon]|nr:MAG: rhomboid family intramembrane serine protease [Candidatus Bathyarchaeota archaeon]
MKWTSILIIICILASLGYWFGYESFVENHLVYSGTGLAQGALWTPITTLFVHFDLAHLVGNIAFLSVFGSVVEKESSGKTTLTAFFVGGVGSLLVGTVYYGLSVTMIGASGAIFTLAAAAMLIKPLKLSLLFFFIPLGLVALLYFIFNVFAVLWEFGGNVGYIAHVAGFLIGLPFGIAVSEGEWLKNLGITILLLAVFVAIIYVIQISLKFLV